MIVGDTGSLLAVLRLEVVMYVGKLLITQIIEHAPRTTSLSVREARKRDPLPRPGTNPALTETHAKT